MPLAGIRKTTSKTRTASEFNRPITALISDLKQQGLLESTLLIWKGEFGWSLDNGVRGGVKYGRDHNVKAIPFWLAGGGVKTGQTIGATDELGAEAVEEVNSLRNLHVTLLKLLGLDDNKLTYFHGGRFKQLSQTGGEVIEELLACTRKRPCGVGNPENFGSDRILSGCSPVRENFEKIAKNSGNSAEFTHHRCLRESAHRSIALTIQAPRISLSGSVFA